MMFIYNDIQLVSINEAKTVSRGRIIKTTKLRRFQEDIKALTRSQMCGQGLVYDRKKQGLELKITICTEYAKFWTKQKQLSMTSGDIDGGLKYLIDAIFSQIGLNDAFITSLHVKKLPAKKKGVFVSLDTIEI
jgi:Holliday junction resolvase RusA-like endonuclease